MFALAFVLACQLSASDRAWIASARDAWTATSRDGLQLAPAPMPRMVFFDAACTADGVTHGGNVALPDGETIPARVTSFAATYGKDAKPYLAMSLPSLWRKEPKLDRLTRVVFVHEMTHTRQSRVMGARIDEVANANGLADEMDDDIVQKRFGRDPAMRAAVDLERELLYAAAREADRTRRCLLATEAVAAMKSRRATLPPPFAELEDIFLNMEGVANWAAWYEAKREGEPDPTAFIRGSKWWSQDEGLAIFLVLDAMLPGWQQRVFAEKPASVMELLEEAVR